MDPELETLARNYLDIKRQNFLTFRQYLRRPKPEDAWLGFVEQVKDEPSAEELQTAMKGGEKHAHHSLEVALRYMKHLTTSVHVLNLATRRLLARPSVDGTLLVKILDRISNPDYEAPVVTRCRALSALSFHYLRMYNDYLAKDMLRQADAMLYLAGGYADDAAFLGPICTYAMVKTAEAIASRMDPDGSRPLPAKHKSEFEGMKEMFHQFVRYTRFMGKAESPRFYMLPCSAGCGIMATKRSTFFTCRGACPPNVKPLYCGKACQKLVRPRFRIHCPRSTFDMVPRTGSGTSASVTGRPKSEMSK